MYPNPSNGLVNITYFGNDKSADLAIYDIAGKTVYSSIIYGEQQTSLNLSSGLYSVKISDKSEVLFQKLIICQ
ncbi:MAG: T9SS type A sorting domain-containing protein [Bacteroidales bacterium]|nr:T9SS type A sorting domain-containing protein [Bacteroidales bacterium]